MYFTHTYFLFCRSLYSFVIPFFGSTGLFSVGTSASLVNYSSVENISQARFLCEAGILTEKNFSSKLNKQIQTSGKSWCSRLATNYTAMGNDKWLGKSDPSSFSNPGKMHEINSTILYHRLSFKSLNRLHIKSLYFYN